MVLLFFKVAIATDLGRIVTIMQLERSEVAFFIFTNGSTLRSNLTQRFGDTDLVLNNMDTWAEISVPAISTEDDIDADKVLLNRSEFSKRLNELR